MCSTFVRDRQMYLPKAASVDLDYLGDVLGVSKDEAKVILDCSLNRYHSPRIHYSKDNFMFCTTGYTMGYA